jgi:chromosome segregation ATPase
MTKRRTILLLVVSSLLMVFTVQSISQPRSLSPRAKQSNAKRNSTPTLDREQKLKEFHERVAKTKKEFLDEKAALGATEEQWKLIKAKLEKVRQLRDRSTSTVGISMTSSNSSGTSSKGRMRQRVPTWQWKQPWKDKNPSELTEAQKLTKRLIALVENNNTTPQQFKQTMDALRKARKEEAQIKRQLAETQKELREILTTRQEAALVLMNWL